MTLSRITRPIVSVMLAFLVLVGAPLAASAAPATDNVRVVTYDASQAAEFKQAVEEAVQIWNNNVTNVRWEAGSQADVTILADDGWPRAQVEDLGVGTVWMGRQAVNEGHDEIRIAAHELGHIYGMPDRRTGVCSELMSGASAGPECTNATPNQAEIDEVEANFADGISLRPKLFSEEVALAR